LPASSQLAALRRLRSSVDAGIASIGELKNLIPVLVQLLGGNGTRTYLIEQVNPAELRAGGGFIGSFSILVADRGNLEVTRSEGSEAVDYPRASLGRPGYVAPPQPWPQFIGDASWDLADSNFFPDFPRDAQAAEMFLSKEAGIKADGVISLDPGGIATVLKVIGPITIPGYDLTVSAANFAELVFQYENSSNSPLGRKRFLAAAAVPLIRAVMALPTSRWPALIAALNEAATARHLQAFFNDETAEAVMNRYGWSGILNSPANADFLLETESNATGSKANHFLERTYDLQLSALPGRIHHKLLVQLNNNTPATGVEGSSQYRCYVRFYVPATATEVRLGPIEADNSPNPDRPAGLAMADGWLWIHPELGNRTWTLTFEYDTPSDPAQVQHTIYWQKQPGTEPDRLKVTWSFGGRSFTTSGQLSQDQVVTLTKNGVTVRGGEPATAHMPAVTI